MEPRQFKTQHIVIAAVVVGLMAFTYGALTAPQPTNTSRTAVSVSQSPSASPSSSPASTNKPTTSPSTVPQASLDTRLANERSTIEGVLGTAYPKITTDYTIGQGKLYGNGEWYGTTLTYHGADTENRDTLRVLMQKKDGKWEVRTKPPQPLLSTKAFPDVPKKILQDINKAVSLP